MRYAALLLVAVITVAGCGNGTTSRDDAAGDASATATPEESSALDEAADCHGGTYDDYLYVTDGGSTLILETQGDESLGAPFDVLDCVFARLDMPQSVISQIERTRALDGTLDAAWDQFEASWTYHPDSGLSLIVETSEG